MTGPLAPAVSGARFALSRAAVEVGIGRLRPRRVGITAAPVVGVSGKEANAAATER